MPSDIHSILNIIGLATLSSVSIISVIGFIVKKFLDQYLQSNLELFKHKRQLEVEKAKMSLEVEKSKISIVFAKLYEQRALVIKDLHFKFMNLNDSINLLLHSNGLWDSEFPKVKIVVEEISTILRRDRLYLNKSVIDSSKEFLKLCEELLNILEEEVGYSSSVENSLLNGGGMQDNDPDFIIRMNLLKTDIVSKIGQIETSLEVKFKEIIGIEQ